MTLLNMNIPKGNPGFSFVDWLVKGFKIEPRPKIFKGMPDDQIRSELVRIMHTIDARTGYTGGDAYWWSHQICQYLESDHSSETEDLSHQMADLQIHKL